MLKDYIKAIYLHPRIIKILSIILLIVSYRYFITGTVFADEFYPITRTVYVYGQSPLDAQEVPGPVTKEELIEITIVAVVLSTIMFIVALVKDSYE